MSSTTSSKLETPDREGSALARVTPVFSCVFAITYVIALDYHPMFTYFTYAPRPRQWFAGVPNLGAHGPGMFWFSWLATSFVLGLIAAVIAMFAPTSLRARFWPGLTWLIPALVIVLVAYILRPWFGFA